MKDLDNDRQTDTARAIAAVELLLAAGYRWHDFRWKAPPAPAAPLVDDREYVKPDEALESIDALDEFSRMAVSVIPTGPVAVLQRFVSQYRTLFIRHGALEAKLSAANAGYALARRELEEANAKLSPRDDQPE